MSTSLVQPSRGRQPRKATAARLLLRPWHVWLAWAICTLVLLLAGAGLVRGDGEPAKPIQPPHLVAALIKLTGPVDEIMFDSIQRRVNEARQANCDLIVYEINTDGGLLTSAIEISQFNKKLDTENLPTVAYIHSTAYAAGAVVALSCGQIVMAPDAKLGDCGPIAINDDQAAGESPLLKELEDSARVRGWSLLLVHAMMVRNTEVYELHNAITEESKFVGTRERDTLLRATSTTPDGKSVTTWRLIDPPVNKAGQFLTIDSAKDGIRLGLAKAQVNDEAELLALLNIRDNLIPMDYTVWETIPRWLTEPWVQSILFFLMLILAYIEFSHPGTAVCGVGALVCLVLLVGAPYLTGMAHAWEIVLIFVGLVIIIADLVAYGGVGLLAVPGFILVAIGIVATFVPTEPGHPWVPQMSATYVGLQTGLSVVIFGSLASIATFFMLARYLHMTPGLRRLRLAPVTGPSKPVPAVNDVTARMADEAVFIGAIGQVTADLHPAGKATFGDQLVDVIAQSQFIAAGTVVEVIEVAGHNVVVRPHK